MTKKSRAPRRRKPNITPLQLAVLTGAPLPADVSPWYVANLEHPDQPGLLSVGVCATPTRGRSCVRSAILFSNLPARGSLDPGAGKRPAHNTASHKG